MSLDASYEQQSNAWAIYCFGNNKVGDDRLQRMSRRVNATASCSLFPTENNFHSASFHFCRSSLRVHTDWKEWNYISFISKGLHSEHNQIFRWVFCIYFFFFFKFKYILYWNEHHRFQKQLVSHKIRSWASSHIIKEIHWKPIVLAPQCKLCCPLLLSYSKGLSYLHNSKKFLLKYKLKKAITK